MVTPTNFITDGRKFVITKENTYGTIASNFLAVNKLNSLCYKIKK